MRLIAIHAALACIGLAAIFSPSVVQADIKPAAALKVPSESPDQWFRNGANTAIQHGSAKAKAKNIILFVGDGMSLPTVAAARIFQGQQRGQSGEENSLSFETLPYTGLSKTYNTDSQTPDSAGTMTAMITGVKTRMGMLSVDQTVSRGSCNGTHNADIYSALELAEIAGMATGVVTTTRITHATPAATYAHISERNWENDAELSEDAKKAGCKDIAAQFTDFNLGDGIEVAMGGGRVNFLPAGFQDPEYPEFFGGRLDNRNLPEEWLKKVPQSQYVWNKQQFDAIDFSKTKHLLGLFEPEHMNFETDRAKDRRGEPSLAEMTSTAIKILKNNPNGFFLMVEAGRIDHAHHGGNAYRALADTVALSDAVKTALEQTAEKDTLIIVTADHSHTLSFAGYPARGNPILGKVVGSSGEGSASGYALDATGLPYTTLSYANGPGYTGKTDQQAQGIKTYPHLVSGVQSSNGRPNLNDVDTQQPDFMQEATVPTTSETHGGDDVGIWARGPGANAVRGTVEQNVIFHYLTQANPRLRKLIYQKSYCDKGVPTKALKP
jgi:alkaline phosphatase